MIKWKKSGDTTTGATTVQGITFAFTIRPGEFFQRLRMSVVVSAGDRVLSPHDGGSIAAANDLRWLKRTAAEHIEQTLPHWRKQVGGDA